jgi:hypothetical protein
MYDALWVQNNSQTGLGSRLEEDLHLAMIKKNGETVYNSAKNTIDVFKTEDKGLTSEQRRVGDMFSNRGYPEPIEIRNGVKTLLSKKEYVDKFIKMAKAKEIKNFDPSGTGEDSDGGNDEDWMVTHRTRRGTSTEFDLASAKGKASFIHNQITTMVNSKLAANSGSTYLSIKRNLVNSAGTDLSHMQTVSAPNTTNTPPPGSEAEALLKYEQDQRKAVSASASQQLNFVVLTDNYDDLANISLEGNDVTSDQAKLARFVYNKILGDPNNKGVFNMTYMPNIGPQIVNGEGKIISESKAAYVINNFDPLYLSTLAKASDVLPSFVTAKSLKVLSETGIAFVFDRSGQNDINPSSYRNSTASSYIAQNIAMSDNNQFKKEYPVDSTGFSPGKFFINMGSPGHYSATYTTRTFVPLTQKQFDNKEPNFIENTTTVDLPTKDEQNAGGYLNKQYSQIVQAIEQTQKKNAFEAKQHRSVLKEQQKAKEAEKNQ